MMQFIRIAKQKTKLYRRRIAALGVGAALLGSPWGVSAAGRVDYTYDALGRLTQVSYANPDGTTTVTYSYDAAGNRTSVTSLAPSGPAAAASAHTTTFLSGLR